MSELPGVGMTEQTDAAEVLDPTRDPRIATMLVLRGLDGSEMPHPDPAGYIASLIAAAEVRGAQAVLAAVEGACDGYGYVMGQPTKRMLAAARAAAAAAGGGGEA